MLYYVVFNNTSIFPLFDWNAGIFQGTKQLNIATDNLITVRDAVTNLKSIKIIDEEQTICAEYTSYNGYSSIVYNGRGYSPLIGGLSENLLVTLTKVDLIEQVQRLDEKINPVIDTSTMTLEELKAYKISEFSKQGEQVIFNGTDVALTDGSIKNFTYNLEDQSNLLNALLIIDKLDDLTITLPYHGHGEPCELYSALDILLVYFTLQFFSTRMQTYINMLNSWVRESTTRAQVEEIHFNSELPQEYVERMEAIMGPAMELAEQLRRKYFPETEEITEEQTE